MKKRCGIARRALDKYPLHLDTLDHALILEGFNRELIDTIQTFLPNSCQEQEGALKNLELSPIRTRPDSKLIVPNVSQEEEDFELAVRLSQEWNQDKEQENPPVPVESHPRGIPSSRKEQEKADLELAMKLNRENYLGGSQQPLPTLERRPSQAFALSDDEDLELIMTPRPSAGSKPLVQPPSISIDLLSSDDSDPQNVENAGPKRSSPTSSPVPLGSHSPPAPPPQRRWPLEEVALTPRPKTPVSRQPPNPTKVQKKPKLNAKDLFGNVSSMLS